MTETNWAAVDDYLMDAVAAPDPATEAARGAAREAGLPAIDVSEAQGRFLALMVRVTGARRVLEIGTLGGYSTIWMARALPEGGRLVTIEYAGAHADVAAANLARAGVADKVDLRRGAGLAVLPMLEDESAGPFDLIFVDADKPNNPGYLDWALRLSRAGTVILIDNVVRGGRIAGDGVDAAVEGTRAMFAAVKSDRRLTATVLQTVGAKGWDGFLMAVVE